jgi:hypothetical protein
MLSGAGSAAAGFSFGFLLMRRAGPLRGAATGVAASALFACEAFLLAGVAAALALAIGSAIGLVSRAALDRGLATQAEPER